MVHHHDALAPMHASEAHLYHSTTTEVVPDDDALTS